MNVSKDKKREVALASLSTLPDALADNALTVYQWSRSNIPQRCVDHVLGQAAYSQASRLSVEALLIGLWLIQDFWFSGERDTAWAVSLKKRRQLIAPRQKELRNFDEYISKLTPAKDRWLTTPGRQRMQILLIAGLLNEVGATSIKVAYLRPLYPIVVPFITAEEYAEVMSKDLASDEWRELADRKSFDDPIYYRVRTRFHELKEVAGEASSAFRFGARLLRQVKAILQNSR